MNISLGFPKVLDISLFFLYPKNVFIESSLFMPKEEFMPRRDSNQQERRPYQPPQIVEELELTTRAGSPVDKPTDDLLDPFGLGE